MCYNSTIYFKGVAMLDAFYVDMPQYAIYNTAFSPISAYSKEHSGSVYDEKEIQKLIPYAKQTDFILSTFREIVDDLTYDKEKFEGVIYKLDDDYELLNNFVAKLNPKLKMHKDLYDISQNILTNLIKVQNDLGLIIANNEHKND